MDILKLVMDNFSRSYTEYRFDKISNFLTYEEFKEKEAIDALIYLGETLRIMRRFKSVKDEELHAIYFNNDNQVPKDSYDKKKYFEAKKELDRRGIGLKDSLDIKNNVNGV